MFIDLPSEEDLPPALGTCRHPRPLYVEKSFLNHVDSEVGTLVSRGDGLHPLTWRSFSRLVLDSMTFVNNYHFLVLLGVMSSNGNISSTRLDLGGF